MANGVRSLVARWSRSLGVVWLALVVGATLAIIYAFLYGPLVILAYWAAPLAILAAVLSWLQSGNVVFTSADVSLVTVLVWWVLGSAVGGFIGGLGYVAEFAGELIFFGGLLSIAQWIVLRRYLWHAGVWVVASFFGWIVAQMLVISIQGAFPGLVEAAHETTRSDVFAYALFDPIVWALYGAAQAIVLFTILRRRALPWLLPWVFASSTGGVLEAAAIYLELNSLLGSWGGGFAAFISVAIYQSAICALYGIPTGLVLYGALQQADTAEQRP